MVQRSLTALRLAGALLCATAALPLLSRQDGRAHAGDRAGPAAPATRLELFFSYYPSLNRLRVMVDASQVEGADQLELVELVLMTRAGVVVWRDSLPLDDARRAARVVELPELLGEYELCARLVDPQRRTHEVRRSFERKVIEGESSSLGTQRDVYAPFKPLRYADYTLHAVLREHSVGKLALWDQVVAQAAATGVRKPLLAAPMRVIAVVDGVRRNVVADTFQVTEKRADAVSLKSGFRAGGLHVTIETTTAVDGMTWHGWTLHPSGSSTVNSLLLEIPLRGEHARMLHAMSDSIRGPFSQVLPTRQGVVWSATTLKPEWLVANFASYVYLGSGVRGLAWFAENDKNWGWDPTTPNVEIVREGDVVLLRVHLLNLPQKIASARTLHFGLQAAPIKPKIEGWRYRWSRENFSLLGTDINWLGGSDLGSLYPVQGDMYYWQALSDANQGALSNQRVADVVKRGTPYFSSFGDPALLPFWKNHVQYNLGPARRGVQMVFYYNRASSPINDELRTYLDEWALFDYRQTDLSVRSRSEVTIVPTTSYDNIATYWYKKSFEHGRNHGVYWDNWFLYGSSNTEMSEAYTLGDGSVRKSAGILGLRELSRRTFQWLNSEDKRPVVTMPHMTSTNILPMMGFATFQLDWESLYGFAPIQERFPREYLQLVTTGELAGTVPVTLIGTPDVESKFIRSDAAVRLVHELDLLSAWGRGIPAFDKAVHEIVSHPDLQAYRYWDERAQPARSLTADVLAIDYVLPGQRTLVGIGSWRKESTRAVIVLDWPKLGLKPGQVQVRNVESGQVVPLRGNRLSVDLAGYDAALLEITPKRWRNREPAPAAR